MWKSPLVLISAFCKQWKLFLLLISALSPPGTPQAFRRSLPCSSLALFVAELEEFIVLWKLCCHGNSGTLNFNCKAQYMFMKIINKNANREGFITLEVSFLLWCLFSCLSHSCYFAEKRCTGAEFFWMTNFAIFTLTFFFFFFFFERSSETFFFSVFNPGMYARCLSKAFISNAVINFCTWAVKFVQADAHNPSDPGFGLIGPCVRRQNEEIVVKFCISQANFYYFPVTVAFLCVL